MAIYKPSNCTPFLTCLDLTKAQDITCELNTSNELVTGYKIKILDSNNDVIFEGAKFDPINPVGYENSGLNGSTLVLPLIVEGEAINNNTIGYQNGEYNVKDPTGTKFDATRFSNGYINQPYKWEIVLEQGNTTGVKADKFYDMTITQGKVLGSTRNRIQSYLSDNIYKDYFIQLNNTSKRVLINSYDHTYGYLYPQENKFTDEEVEAATFFEIYKFSNDPDVIAAGSQVAYAISKSMSEVTIEDKTSSTTWGSNLVYPYYFEQVFEGLTRSYTAQNDIPNSAFDPGMSGFLVIGTNVMVKGESEGANAFNGIFTLNSVSEKEREIKVNGETKILYDLTLKWLRSTPGNTWANLTNAVFYVQNGTDGGTRWQVNTDTQTVGTINQTPVIFIREKPVEIYTDASKGYHSDKTKGQIFKNTIGQVYIRPFIGIESGMRFSYLKKGEIAYKNINDFIIDTETWQLSGDIGEILKPDETQYKISSYFKGGDENPFYAYAEPTVSIYYDGNLLPSDLLKRMIASRRTATFQGVFEQINNKTWINYQWFIVDLSDGTTEQSDKFYSGDLSYTFQGLQDKHIYQVILVVEDEFGTSHKTYGNIEIEIDFITGTTDLTVELDCLTQSYIIDFNKLGIVIPDPSNQTLKYRVYNSTNTGKENYTVKETDEPVSNYEYFNVENSYDYGYTIDYPESQSGRYLSLSDIKDVNKMEGRDSLMKYDKLQIIGEETIASIPSPTGDSYTMNSQHRLGAGFNGDIIRYEIDVDDSLFGTAEAIIKVYLPPVTKMDSNGEIVVYTDDSLTSYSQYEVNSTDVIGRKDYTVIKAPNSEELFFVKDIGSIANRYSIIALYIKKYSENDEILLASKILNWNEERGDVKIVSAWVPQNEVANDSYDYLDTDIVYDALPENSNYRHIRGEGALNSKGKIGYVFSEKEDKAYSYFNDKKRVVVTQANGEKINVLNGEYNYWNDTYYDENGEKKYHYWFDKGSEEGIYEQTNINNSSEHTGRQFVNDKIWTLNLGLRNYNTTLTAETFNSQNDFIFNLFEEEAK